jgi:acyl-CoA thioesterase FadM
MYAIGRTIQVAYDYKTRATVRMSGKLKKELAKYVGPPINFREVD